MVTTSSDPVTREIPDKEISRRARRFQPEELHVTAQFLDP
jgi:hypothetical protein